MTAVTEPPTTRYRDRHAPHPIDPLYTATNSTDLQQLARALGISDRWARELKATGLTDEQADRYAIRAGYHPSVLWPHWWNIEPDIDEDDHGIMR